MGAAGAARCADRSRAHSQHVAVLRTSTVLPPERQNRCPLDSGGHLFWRLEALNRVDGWSLTQYQWESLGQVQEAATQWMWSYNHERPHMALGGITPKQRYAMTA